MATAAFDLRAQATFPIRLGASISKPETSTRFTSVRYNWKPELKQGNSSKAFIREGDGAGETKLSLRDDDGEYTYSGKHVRDEDSFVLVFRGAGKEREVVLERMSSSHAFNLISTPEEKDAAKLAEIHPLLPAENGDDDLFGAEEDEPPDESNPFDFRHFLKAEQEEATNANSQGTIDTPLTKPAPRPAAVSKPAKRAEPKATPSTKRKTPATGKGKNKRVKAGEEPPTPAESTKAKPKPDVPKINMDRKASLRRTSVEDSGELVLEDSSPAAERPRSLALALSGKLNAGPVSLHSAANSPGSHIASPEPERPDEDGEGEYVFEFDDEPEPEAEDEEDADADVDRLELPSPAQASRPSVSGAPAVEEEDDLDAQLAAAMMEAEDGGQEDNESEESEEE